MLTPVDPFLGDTYKYSYNGMELQEDLNINWHDYGARNYDAALGRWMNIDPLTEKYETISGYTYVLNNPVNAIDPDGRLVIFVNGLIFGKASSHKFGSKYLHYEYPPPRRMYRGKEPMMFGERLDYWGEMDNQIMDYYGDTNSGYINATDNFKSQASDRFSQGQKSGLELIEKLKNGTIELENEETIKIVGHSQGAAFAAGMLTSLANSEYADRLEIGIYIAPHQPGDFTHPEGVLGAQFSTESDQVSSNGKGSGLKGTLLQLFNGRSKLAEIDGIEVLQIRKKDNEEHNGHGVSTWTKENIMQTIYNYLNCEDDCKNDN